MNDDFQILSDDAKAESGKDDIDDIFSIGVNYFNCGYRNIQEKQFYNHSMAVALALVGALCDKNGKGGSNYHRGVAYIANKLNISKRQVKVLRKQLRWKGGYAFRTPYIICGILVEIIDVLNSNLSDNMVKAFLESKDGIMYRDILSPEQYAAIKRSASVGERDKVKHVAEALNLLTDKVSWR